jgi:nucleoside-diphosphate-sugar epimerase
MWKPLRYDNARAKRDLCWTPRVPMTEAFARTFSSLQ